uniref:HAT C-terminal dimerisation domain-containing protein n=1 Tax=Panagrolaimus sp. JU765 TaxID=591449 RepID=A0AC34RGR9_9BILA
MIRKKVDQLNSQEDEIIVQTTSNTNESSSDDFWLEMGRKHAPTLNQQTKFEKEIMEYLLIVDGFPAIQIKPQIQSQMDKVAAFWKEHKTKWPILYQLFQKYHQITASSAEPERLFSNLTDLLSDPRRSRLDDENIENLMKINSYMALKMMERNKKAEEAEIFELGVDDLEFLD